MSSTDAPAPWLSGSQCVARFCFGCDCMTGHPTCVFCSRCCTKICTSDRDSLWEPEGDFVGMLEICRQMKEPSTERVIARAQAEKRFYDRQASAKHDYSLNFATKRVYGDAVLSDDDFNVGDEVFWTRDTTSNETLKAEPWIIRQIGYRIWISRESQQDCVRLVRAEELKMWNELG